MGVTDLLKLWRPGSTWLVNEAGASWSSDAIRVEVSQEGPGDYRAVIMGLASRVDCYGHGANVLSAVFAAIMRERFVSGEREGFARAL